jgi:hypothetical protein
MTEMKTKTEVKQTGTHICAISFKFGKFVTCEIYRNLSSISFAASFCFYGVLTQINDDFKSLHPSSADKMAAVWPQLWPKIVDRLRKKQVSDKNLKEHVSLLKSDDTLDGK